MATTFNLPMKKWYFDQTTQWTLDYPPLFAAFEFFLALVASILNLDDALELTENSAVRTEQIIVYQKTTVIISDLIYYYAIYKLCTTLDPFLAQKVTNGKENQPLMGKSETVTTKKERKSLKQSQDQGLVSAFYRPNATTCMALLLIFQPGLLMVDHIHFQYNGFLTGVLLLSISSITAGRYYMGAFWFTVLLNLKHIYLYYAPAVGMYLLASYVLVRDHKQNILLSSIRRSVNLALVVLMVLGVSLAPYADLKTFQQIISRLFPFRRGLTHAYWAPNFWSLYNVADKVLATVFRDSLIVKFDLDSISTKVVSSTSGLVQEYKHQYLPSIEPIVTFYLVAIFLLPQVIKHLTQIGIRSHEVLLKSLVLAAFTSFMFGWHVHEKAIILVLIPMIPVCMIDSKMTSTFLRLSLAGTYSLFPLLYQPAEYLVKSALLIGYYTYSNDVTSSFSRSMNIEIKKQQNNQQTRWRTGIILSKLMTIFDKIFVLALLSSEIYVSLLHGRLNYEWNPLLKLNRFAFLPLMLTSSLSAVGIVVSYLEIYYDFVFGAREPAATAADEVVDDA